jgi:hypothetical protein
MADRVTLNVSQMQNVLELRRLAGQRSQASGRLASGRTVSQIADGPRDYLRASALADRASKLLGAKAGIGLAIDSLGAARTGVAAVHKLGEQLKGLALAAQSADPDGRTELAAQFDTVRQQIDLLVADASFQGTNLLGNPAASLDVLLSEQAGSTLSIGGRSSDAAALGIGDATAYNGFATAADVEAALGVIDNALATLRGAASQTAADTAILGVREAFAGNLAETLRDGAAKLAGADLNAEGARLLSVQARDALAQEGLRLTARSQSQLAALIGS